MKCPLVAVLDRHANPGSDRDPGQLLSQNRSARLFSVLFSSSAPVSADKKQSTGLCSGAVGMIFAGKPRDIVFNVSRFKFNSRFNSMFQAIVYQSDPTCHRSQLAKAIDAPGR